jgi:cellulose synthase/poly-beta-1,6-N-acetylglucosamine synthase-like glycosyltransferase
LALPFLFPMLLLLAVALAVQVACWAGLGWGLARVRAPESDPGGRVPVSVVVAARNEEGRLPALMDALAEQTHPAFEAVIVDDASEDGTAALVERRATLDPRFRLVRVDETEHPELPRKKRALTLGIAAARHDRLAFTDADCAPPPGWLEALAAHAASQPEAVLVGYGPYRTAPGALNAFVRYETFLTALLTAAAVGFGRPFMAVGRNFSYPKALFERLGGFAHQAHSLSGDDDLLVQEAHRHGAPVRYVLDPAAVVPSEAPGSWRQWLRQKLRHTSAGRHYDRGAQVGLAVFHASALAVWVAPVFLGWTGAALLAGRFLVQRAVLRRAAEAFAPEPGLLAAQPMLDLGYVLYNTFVAPLGALRTPRAW